MCISTDDGDGSDADYGSDSDDSSVVPEQRPKPTNKSRKPMSLDSDDDTDTDNDSVLTKREVSTSNGSHKVQENDPSSVEEVETEDIVVAAVVNTNKDKDPTHTKDPTPPLSPPKNQIKKSVDVEAKLPESPITYEHQKPCIHGTFDELNCEILEDVRHCEPGNKLHQQPCLVCGDLLVHGEKGFAETMEWVQKGCPDDIVSAPNSPQTDNKDDKPEDGKDDKPAGDVVDEPEDGEDDKQLSHEEMEKITAPPAWHEKTSKPINTKRKLFVENVGRINPVHVCKNALIGRGCLTAICNHCWKENTKQQQQEGIGCAAQGRRTKRQRTERHSNKQVFK